MLQGAAYHPGPLYGNSHYKKFWLKKMQSEESVREPDAFRATPPESFGGGIFRKCSNDVNCSRLEMKGSSRPSFGVPARRSESSQMFLPSFADERHRQGEKQIFDCALSIGVPALCEREEDNFPPALENSGSGMHKFRLQSLTRLLRPDSDLQTAGNSAEKTAETEFSDGSVTRTCSDCKTDKTPLWRNGPNGPKSLCNACGIRYKKITKQRSASNGDGGTRKTPTKLPSSVRQMTKLLKRKRDTTEPGSQDPAASRKKSAAALTEAPPTGAFRGFSNDKQRSSTTSLLKRSFGKDEEEGAVLLMGLSCGLVNAKATVSLLI